MSPNPGRVKLLSELVAYYQVDGVIDITWHTRHICGGKPGPAG
jgi:benzoyl-CoA reductase/2-hydroxyglutaryl-CoA dehydratase subunit BcrC/BadD/HgdB